MNRILVVEDEPAIAELISMNLRHAGFEVTFSAGELLARIRTVRRRRSPETLDTVVVGGPAVDPATRESLGSGACQHRIETVGGTGYRLAPAQAARA